MISKKEIDKNNFVYQLFSRFLKFLGSKSTIRIVLQRTEPTLCRWKTSGGFFYQVFCFHGEYSCVETTSASQFNCVIAHISEKLQDCGDRIKGCMKWPDCLPAKNN